MERIAGEAADPVQATVARLAADGLWLQTCSGSPRPRASSASSVMARMLALADGD